MSKMDPVKKIGKLKEQIETEHKARRNFPRKWGMLTTPDVNKFYNPEEISCQLKETLKLKDLCPYTYTGKGDSYFVSKDMYNTLLAKCRCGRPCAEAHMVKCLQKQLSDYDVRTADIIGKAKQDSDDVDLGLPKTSNAVIGWQKGKPVYQQWEKSMKYVSPVYTMPGFRVTTTPYNVIIIG